MSLKSKFLLYKPLIYLILCQSLISFLTYYILLLLDAEAYKT